MHRNAPIAAAASERLGDRLSPRANEIVCRRPTRADASAVHALVRSSPPLDVNSTYAYLLLCTHFAATSAVAECDGAIVGFVSGYLEPEAPDTLFIWQVAVAPTARGRGVGRRLLDEVIARPACAGVRYLETTIGPDNDASWRLFRGFARAHAAACESRTAFSGADFGAETHDDEQLLRIGPLGATRQGGT